MTSPYITTYLNTTINLNPRQMDNRIYKNLKDNLINKVEGRCYRNYGFISKVYDIKEYSQGLLISENPMTSATFGVKFTCRLCHPLKGRQIICKIMKINNMIVNAQNGPITMIITSDRINNNNFFQDPKTGKIYVKNGDSKVREITPGTYIIATVSSKTFNDTDSIIMAMGELQRLATDEEIRQNYKQEHSVDENVVNYDDYINGLSNIDITNLTKDQKEEIDAQKDDDADI